MSIVLPKGRSRNIFTVTPPIDKPSNSSMSVSLIRNSDEFPRESVIEKSLGSDVAFTRPTGSRYGA